MSFCSGSVTCAEDGQRRQPSPRSPAPPSSFPPTLYPVASNDLNPNAAVQRRISRSDLDFEQALRTGGTVVLKEGLDVDSLGADISNTSISFSTPSPSIQKHYVGLKPATPTVVPPTPSPVVSPRPGPSNSSRTRPSLLPSSSSNDVFSDAQDSDYQTRRRSMYRSPGTASSPDLATLLRKAKERGGPANRESGKAADSTLTPNRAAGSRGMNRQQSSPTSSPQASPAPRGKPRSDQLLGGDHGGVGSVNPEWAWTSPRSAGPPKNPKSSVRAKTSAFLGKMLGSSSTRERSRTITSSPSTTSITSYPLMDAFTPPVPPIPPKHQSQYSSPRAGPSDVFTDAPSTVDMDKMLPPTDSIRSDLDDLSLVMVDGPLTDRSRSPSPTKTLKERPLNGNAKHVKLPSRSKRRSMSVSDADIKKVMNMGATSTSARMSSEARTGGLGWDSALSGIISDFKGELSQLDPISTGPLDLRDPTTPSRRPALAALRARSEDTAPRGSPARPPLKLTTSAPMQLPTPRVTLQPAEGAQKSYSAGPSLETRPSVQEDNTEVALVPPRSSSLRSQTHTPPRARSGSSGMAPRVASMKYGPRAQPMRNGTAPVLAQAPSPSTKRDAERLRVQHRSTASTSEPSLIPEREDGRVQPGLSASSQQDLTTNDLVNGRLNLHARGSPMKSETADLLVRGKELASRCWVEDEDFLAKDKIAEWLGGQGLINKTALRFYMDYFDFSGLRLDHAFRRLCAKLYLKAETQQLDRILEEFARRYFDCNPTTIFGSSSVVHAVTYSLLLLNTDLHVAELTSRMSRGQFVRNTISTIQMQLQPNQGSNSDLSYDDWTSFRAGSESDVVGTTVRSRAKRSDSITSWNSINTREGISTPAPLAAHSTGQLSQVSDSATQSPMNESAVSVALSSGQESRNQELASTPIMHDRNWEVEVESILKEMYAAVKSQQILQPINSALLARPSTSSLSPHGPLLRQRSLRTGPPDRLNNLKRGSIRGLQSILQAQAGVSPYSSNSSIDGRASPAPSFANSIEGIRNPSTAFLTPALGFASNLSHTIIRETQEDDHLSYKSDLSGTDVSITDEELALLGPPWAKEGMLCRKQYWDSTGKRAKSKAWMDVFVVIQKGELSMFVFGEHGHGGSGVVGGGNWLENAQSVGKVLLAHSLAHALPPPGYNRQRPHCMVLTLSNGGVYFFQAGTEELVNEWVSTCNYWAARQSKEPLAGGVSNMEYGWNRVLDPITRVRSISEDNFSVRDGDADDGVSIRSGRSGRSGKSRIRDIAATVRAEKSPWADRTFINDWKPPLPPSVPSMHDEETQMEALQKHVTSLKTDLKQHNALRTPMMNLYQPRSSNATKAMSNWEKKSQYLLTEIVKYDSYIDSLQAAMSLRLRKRGEKAMERALVVSSPTEGEFPDTAAKGKWKGQPEEETIEEGEEPPASACPEASSPVHFHRRELAETGESPT
ncbi:uncharacterized protein FIBRA_07943 [Fibroporia radiculosa]|uniref:SEC7 domain-containing protein n=1 Tax=Fibroporia radiculosa TaxID=599839 RepID=J4IC33_9APHY|nr:uncharacterized protein FIBRA_07943 [Fibroporia radiculosa]CCM05711.1 predicted protein [Fibroporia radiculosa]